METAAILTYRDDASGARRANLMAVLAWLAREPEHEVVVVEQDARPRLAAPLPHPRCRVVYAYNPGPFNKGWGFNVGVRAVAARALLFADADVIVPEGRLRAWSALLEARWQLVKPYRRLVDLTPEETARVRAGELDLAPRRSAAAAPDREGIAEEIPLCGGLFLVGREAFLGLGAWDERFRGWGGEDDAFSYKVERARLPTVELDERPALHLWHPRTAATTRGQPHYEANRALLARYRLCSDAELVRLAEVQRQTMGHREKYRPLE